MKMKTQLLAVALFLATPLFAQSAPTVVLTWSETVTVTSFNVYRSTVTGGPYAKIGSTTGTVLTYSDSTVAAGTQYFYVVTAVSGTSESANSNEASAAVVVKPPAPTNLTIMVK